jgi:heme/copper-type cytochrome/quinol oxidase subunit 2
MSTVQPKSDFGKMTHDIFMLISWTTLVIFIAVEAVLLYVCFATAIGRARPSPSRPTAIRPWRSRGRWPSRPSW